MKLIPTLPEIGREALIVICGAILAVFIISRLPAVKKYVKDSWA